MAKRIAFLFVIVLQLTWPTQIVLAQTDAESQAEIATLRERVKELEIRQTVLRSDIREVGGAATSAEGIENAQSRRGSLDTQIWRVDNLIELYGRSRDDLEQLRQQVANEPIKTLADTADGGSANTEEKIAGKAAQLGLEEATGASLGWVPIVAHFVDLGGRVIIRDLNEDLIKQLIESQRVPFAGLLRLAQTLEGEKNAEALIIVRLQELQTEFSQIQADLAPARLRLDMLTGNAHNEASLQRDTDSAGDEEEKLKQRGTGVRLCGPSQRPKPFGVRQARKASGAVRKIAEEEKMPLAKVEEAVAGGGACRDITGFWTFRLTHGVFTSPQPVSVEIAAVETGTGNHAAPSYEIFVPDKAKAIYGPTMRCSLAGHHLTCQVRASPWACPASKVVWGALNMEVASDVSFISGDYVQKFAFDMNKDRSGCTAVPHEGYGETAYRFEPVVEAEAAK